MDRDESLLQELARDYDIQAQDLSPELQLCIDRLDELRRRDRDTDGTSSDLRDIPPMLSSPSENFELDIASGASQREEVFHLRGKAFERAGWVDAGDAAFSDEFDDLPTAVLVSATSGNRIVGTIRVSISKDARSTSMPCELEFGPQLSRIKADVNGRLAEFCRIAVDPDITNSSFRATLYGTLVRTGLLVAKAAHVDFALAAVHSRISLFYQHMYGFQRLAKSASYGIIDQPTHLLGVEFNALVKRSMQRNGFFHVAPAEIDQARALLRATHPALMALTTAIAV